MTEQQQLFATEPPEKKHSFAHEFEPLAARMRPQSLEQYLGQQHILKPGKPLFESIQKGRLHSFILWGPPGTGKTSLAKMIAQLSDSIFYTLSAVMSGVKEIRWVMQQAKTNQQKGLKSILFVDEVHRFNKSQQDAFLPFVEDGTIVFIGATTENPAFELNNALLSRARVYLIKPLSDEQIIQLLERAIQQDQYLSSLGLEVETSLLEGIAQVVNGDARRALNLLEIATDLAEERGSQRIMSEAILAQLLQNEVRAFDKSGDIFYDQISALHKSIRGSDPDASLYWFCRMLDGGCDPLYLARRLVRIASEDIGNADPRGLSIALDGWETQQRLGSPEGELSLAQVVIYLACAPKSNAVYLAFKQTMQDIKQDRAHNVPMHLRNAPTKLAASIGASEGYRYPHDEPDGFAAGVNYFPETKLATNYYQPVDRGLEKSISEKLRYLKSRELPKRP